MAAQLALAACEIPQPVPRMMPAICSAVKARIVLERMFPVHLEPRLLRRSCHPDQEDHPPGPVGQANPAFIWTGRAIIAVDLDVSIGGHGNQGPIRPDDMALWDLATGR
jgi:hypothetical protein